MGDLRATELCSPKTHTDTRQEGSFRELVKALYPKLSFEEPADPGPWDPPHPEILLPR